MDEIVREFITESLEGMERFDSDLLALERDPSAGMELLPGIFRVIHSLKSSCGFLGFAELENLTHAGESLLSGLRDGKLKAGPETFTCLFRMGDAIRGMLAGLEAGRETGGAGIEALRGELAALAGFKDWSRGSGDRAEAQPPASAPAPEAGSGRPEEERGQKEGPAPAERSVRVDVDLLDKLMNLVGELVLVRNQVLQCTREAGDNRLGATSQQLNLITTELQEGIVKTRMQPIRNVWSKFPRLVREVSLACGKRVRIEMEGEDTELDKSVLEAIKDPLTHILRNSIDHGIEPPEVREAATKPVEGRIVLKAYQKDGQVHIEVCDDGAGIDVRKVAFKALDKGLVAPDRLAKLSDHDLAQLIFLPGFSTAEKVTNVSGRGVGMDVVRNNVERIGGSVDLLNSPGRGLTLRIRIPLTLAIIPALIVEAAGQRFAVPQINVVEIVRLRDSLPGRGVEWIQGTPVYRLRGDLIPLVRLGRRLGLVSGGAEEALGERERFMAVLQVENRPFGMLVDAVRDTQEILVKPLSDHLRTLAFFAGATIMGDGKVALILDVPGLAQSCRLSGGGETPSPAAPAVAAVAAGGLSSILVVEVADFGPLAIPLEQVSRLEEIPSGTVETASRLEVVQSRGRLMPILHASRLLAMDAGREEPPDGARPDGTLRVVACEAGEVVVGLAVDRVVDIVEEALDFLLPAMRPGFRGSAIVKGKTMDVLDLHEFVRLALPRLSEAQAEA